MITGCFGKRFWPFGSEAFVDFPPKWIWPVIWDLWEIPLICEIGSDKRVNFKMQVGRKEAWDLPKDPASLTPSIDVRNALWSPTLSPDVSWGSQSLPRLPRSQCRWLAQLNHDFIQRWIVAIRVTTEGALRLAVVFGCRGLWGLGKLQVLQHTYTQTGHGWNK